MSERRRNGGVVRTIQVTVETGGDTEEELRSLLRWLTADEDIGPHAHGVLSASQPPGSEHMGSLLDIISLSVSTGLGAGQLVAGIAQWRSARPASPRVSVHRGTLRVDIHDADPETVRRLTDLLAQPQDDDAGAA
ncbi:effector-associated constant component EACC1 [Streptomyces odontomachi]|uniref:effector-associated constant component EACC1 n=1 Tax=Streptomyces odontomachi TaxID=2944940 RepID=UPI00210BFC81|nr:hypothetical protein [Streptomyces sp. ODS25]